MYATMIISYRKNVIIVPMPKNSAKQELVQMAARLLGMAMPSLSIAFSTRSN